MTDAAHAPTEPAPAAPRDPNLKAMLMATLLAGHFAKWGTTSPDDMGKASATADAILARSQTVEPVAPPAPAPVVRR